ncbi:hypothetical protein ACHAPV_004473 [Trichoderma viride]
MSSLLEKVKDKLSSHSDNKTEQPEGTHGPHSSRTANAADPRIDSDRDHRAALGRQEGTYTTGGDNYSYGESNTKGTNTAGDTLTSSGTTGPAPTTAGMHKSDMLNKVDPRIDSDLDGSKNMGLRSEKATHAGTTHAGTTSTSHGTDTTSSTYGTGTTTTGSSIGTSGTGTTGTGTTFGSTGPASKTAGAHKSDTLNKADPRIDSDLDGSRNMGLRSEKQTRDTGATSGYGVGTTTTSTGNTYSSTEPGHKSAGVHKSDTLNKADPRIDSDLDGSRNMGLRSEQATHGTTRTAGTTGTTGTSFGTGMGTDTLGAGSGINTSGRSGDYTSGTSGLEGRGSGTDTYSGMGKTSGLGSGTGTGAYSGTDTTSGYGSSNLGSSNLGSSNLGSSNLGSSNLGSSNLTSGERNFGQQTGTLGSDTTTSAYGGLGSTGPASNTAGPHKSDMLNKADPRVDSDLDNSKTFGGNKTYQS